MNITFQTLTPERFTSSAKELADFGVCYVISFFSDIAENSLKSVSQWVL